MMELVYLFSSINNQEKVEEYSYYDRYDNKINGKSIEKTILSIGNTGFIVRYSIDSESCKAAQALLNVNCDFSSNFECHCLADGASAYFNKMLFPKMNDFERLLREYIYFKQQIVIANLDEQINNQSDESYKKQLKEKQRSLRNLFNKKPLEEMDFTEIYTKLFVDSRFCDEIKRRFFPENEGKNSSLYKVTKEEYLEFINNQEERILWFDLTEGNLEIIKNNYSKIKKIRNDIMHAHNIDYNYYCESDMLINNVLEELRKELSQIISLPASSINIDGVIAALKTFAIAIDSSRPEIDRKFARLWLNHSHQLNGVISDDTISELLEESTQESSESDEITV